MASLAEDIIIRYREEGTSALLANHKKIISHFEKTANASKKTFASIGADIEKMGRNMQWAGQRITFGLSLPIAYFGKTAYDAFLQADKAVVQLRKVWDGVDSDIDQKLVPAAKRMSVTYGKSFNDIIDVMKEFVKAGLDDIETVEKLTEVTNKISLLFDTELQQTMEATRAVMLGYQLSTEDTVKAMEAINIIADKTASDEAGILEFIKLLGGIGRATGLEIRDLAGYAAAFSANAIPAAEGANAIKFVLQRIQSPTEKATELLEAFNIQTNAVEFRTKRGSEQIEIFAKKFIEVRKQGKKAEDQFRSIIEADFMRALGETAGKRQANRFLVLLEDIGRQFDDNADTVSQYALALEVSGDETKNTIYATEEMSRITESSSFKWAQFTEKLNLAKIEIGAKLIPVMERLIDIVIKATDWFLNLSPATQNFLIIMGTALVVLGPFLTTTGAILQVFGGLFTKIGAVTGAIAGGGGLNGAISALTGGLVGLLGLVIAGTILDAVLIWKAVEKWKEFNSEISSLKNSTNSLKTSNERLKEKMDKITDPEQRERVRKIVEDNEAWADAVDETIKYYDGVWGKVRVIADELRGIDRYALNYRIRIDKSSGGGGGGSWHYGGLVADFMHSGGIPHAQTGMIIPGSSPLRDRVPIMAEQGEGIMSKKAIENLLKNGVISGGGTTYNITFEVGNMIATPGEQREFARKIRRLLEEDNSRMNNQTKISWGTI